jgi:exosortase
MRGSVVNHRIRRQHFLHMSGMNQSRDYRLRLIALVLMLIAVTTWSYWPTMTNLFNTWQTNEDYSAGQLVPIVAVFLLWRERRALRQYPLAPCWWGGVALLVLAQIARTYGLLSLRSSPEWYALVLTVAGLVLMVAGWQVFRRILWILLLLFLMVPLPGRVHNLISGPLQNIATTGSVLFLEAFGVSVSQQGNVVMLNGDMPIAVAEACSGLRMLMAFVIVAAFIAYMVKRPRWQKAILLGSSIPVAVVCNMIRIFATAMLMLYVSVETAQKFFHDFAGFVMMPVAVLLLFGEIWLMDRVVVPEPNLHQGRPIAQVKSAARAHARKEMP